MTTSQLLSSTPGWLLDVALQTTALLVIAGLVTASLPRISAARKHFVQASALLLIPVVMLSSFFAPSWRIKWWTTAAQPTAGIHTTTELDQQSVPPRVASTISMTVAQAEVPYSPMWALLWLAGIGAGGIALGFSALSLRRLRASSRPVTDSAIRRCFQEEAAAFHLRLPDASLRMSTDCHVPMTWGLARKVVLLPEQASAWPEAQLRLVLRHELAHIARGDILVSLLTTLAALMLWFHPLVWLMLRASQRSREQASDDLALAHSGQNAGDFAEELLAAVVSLGAPSSRRWLPLALAMSVSAGAKAMRQRLANLVQTGRGRRAYSGLQKLALLLPALIVAFGLAGLTACRKAEPARDAMILVRSRFISIPVGSPVLAEAGLVVDHTAGLQNLGILSADQATALLQKLSQQKGVDLMSAPSVTTKSGQKATVEVVREFIYPTEFDPPKQMGKDQPVIPTTPTAFEMRPVGVRMELHPIVMEDGRIDLTLTPEVTSFEGFMDYGKPIEKPVQGPGTFITENQIRQPIFHSLKTTTTVTMQPGQSIVFGGLGSPENAPLTDRLPKTKDLIFFIIKAEIVDVASTSSRAVLIKAKIVDAPNSTSPKETAEPAVTVYGQVKRQGKYTLKPGMTVKDLLGQAQGLSDRADGSKAELKRGNKLFVIPLPESTKPLEAGDVLTVPTK
jgi:beta-lactamase regulating signal transducer with metallopeptidase domain